MNFQKINYYLHQISIIFMHINHSFCTKAEKSDADVVNCFDNEVLTTYEFAKQHNKFGKKIELLDDVRKFDVYEQQIDENIPNILNAEI